MHEFGNTKCSCGKELKGVSYFSWDDWECLECKTKRIGISVLKNVLYCVEGDKVVVTQSRCEYDCNNDIKQFIKIESPYTLDKLSIGSSSSEISLKEMPGVYFNSISFERFIEG